ncbi:uncharacterized protein BYT42DRAFT_557678 [Radiomyces spectabilis]|uniref:uncharacterized protein n=1 Tax=Radiomyces spectabilis TaxID=64574 RepID=UPI00221FEF4F|nr:uncharacterized protein BYT42DRAFT_557678 [Radiomyces spectabilis]KAI8391674.1 hypothetical protein BYT42DRAFT_557678 [Radiomyces spectabilis]
MSSRSKTRAKHGHLFGDDPLSAASSSDVDDPLFGPSRRSLSTSRSPATTASAPVTDPLSRVSSSSSVKSSSSSHTKSTSGGIFGDIDVSKLGGGGVFANKRSTHALRSSIRTPIDHDDEESLFGGKPAKSTVKRSPPASVHATADVARTSPIPKSPIASAKKEPSVQPARTPTGSPKVLSRTSSYETTSTRGSVSNERPATPTKREPTVSSPSPINIGANNSTGSPSVNGTVTPPAVPATASSPAPSSPPRKASSSIFASASRFLKSRSPSNPPPPPPPPASQPLPAPASPKITSPPPTPPAPARRSPPPLPPSSSAAVPRPVSQQHKRETEREEEEDEDPMESESIPIIVEDEATRAFADDTMKFSMTKPRADYSTSPELLASLTSDTLRLDEPPMMIPSISTPAATQDTDSLNPWSHTLQFSLEPSSSSPQLNRKRSSKSAAADIDPGKRAAFADLIASWHSGKPERELTVAKEDPEQFFTRVAVEQRDIGFAGIAGSGNDDDDDASLDEHPYSSSLNKLHQIQSWGLEENPWS